MNLWCGSLFRHLGALVDSLLLLLLLTLFEANHVACTRFSFVTSTIDANWPKSHLQMNPNLSRSCGASAPQPPVRARATRASRGQCACARGISQICAHPLRCNDRNVCALIQAKLTRTNSTNGHSGKEKHSATVDTPIGCSSTRWSVSQSVSEPLQ